MLYKKHAGFTLIELMITVAVIAILAAIAVPSYREYIRRSNRVEGQSLLNEAAARQERWRAQNGTYTTTVADLQMPWANNKSEHGLYLLSVTNPAGDGGYTLTATPQGNQATDKCGNFTLTALGTKGVSASTADACWR